MQSQQPSDVLRTRIVEEIKLWAARRYGEQVKGIAAAKFDISPDSSGDADYLVHVPLLNAPNGPDSIDVRVFVEQDGSIRLATGD
jgi:hypothetical protein